MKSLLTLICLSFLIISCGKKQITVPGGKDLTGYEINDIDGSTSSYVIKKDENGNIIEEGMITDGIQNGTWITYFPEESNKMKTVINYVNGAMNGPYLEFNDRGQIEKKQSFTNNKIHGLYAEYKFGRPLKEYMYHDGMLDGYSREYSDRGNLRKEALYKKGKLDGLFKQFDEEGNVVLEYEYNNGEKVIISKNE